MNASPQPTVVPATGDGVTGTDRSVPRPVDDQHALRTERHDEPFPEIATTSAQRCHRRVARAGPASRRSRGRPSASCPRTARRCSAGNRGSPQRPRVRRGDPPRPGRSSSAIDALDEDRVEPRALPRAAAPRRASAAGRRRRPGRSRPSTAGGRAGTRCRSRPTDRPRTIDPRIVVDPVPLEHVQEQGRLAVADARDAARNGSPSDRQCHATLRTPPPGSTGPSGT